MPWARWWDCESRMALTAAAHVVMSRRCCRFADLDAFLDLSVDPVIGGMQADAGVITLPAAPGLGLDVDPAYLATLTRVA